MKTQVPNLKNRCKINFFPDESSDQHTQDRHNRCECGDVYNYGLIFVRVRC